MWSYCQPSTNPLLCSAPPPLTPLHYHIYPSLYPTLSHNKCSVTNSLFPMFLLQSKCGVGMGAESGNICYCWCCCCCGSWHTIACLFAGLLGCLPASLRFQFVVRDHTAKTTTTTTIITVNSRGSNSTTDRPPKVRCRAKIYTYFFYSPVTLLLGSLFCVSCCVACVYMRRRPSVVTCVLLFLLLLWY